MDLLRYTHRLHCGYGVRHLLSVAFSLDGACNSLHGSIDIMTNCLLQSLTLCQLEAFSPHSQPKSPLDQANEAPDSGTYSCPHKMHRCFLSKSYSSRHSYIKCASNSTLTSCLNG